VDKEIKKRGAIFIEYALVLAFVISAGMCFVASGNSSPVKAIFNKVDEKLEIAANGPKAEKYNIAPDAAIYADAIYAILNYLETAPLIHPADKQSLAWVLLKNNYQIDNYSPYKNSTGLQAATVSNGTISAEDKTNFANGLAEALASTNYKANGGSVFYDRDGNIVYSNAKQSPGLNIGGQGRYTILNLTDKTTNKSSYVYYASDNQWHYSASVPASGDYTGN